MPGIRESIYIGGTTIARGPASVTERRDYAKTEQRLRDGTLVSHYLSATDGDPDLMNKHTFSLGFDVLSETDAYAIARLVAKVGALDFCPWTVEVEQWTFAAGDNYGGTLLRRAALDYVSPLPPAVCSGWARSPKPSGR